MNLILKQIFSYIFIIAILSFMLYVAKDDYSNQKSISEKVYINNEQEVAREKINFLKYIAYDGKEYDSSYYGKDEKVYYKLHSAADPVQVDANVKTFIAIDRDIAKDDANVFFKNEIATTVDATTFENTNIGYKDKNGYYYRGFWNNNILIAYPFNREEAQSIDLYGFKAANKVYYQNGDEYEEVVGADAETFKELRGCAQVETSREAYMRDKNHIYVGSTLIKEADLDTFKLLATFSGDEFSEVPFYLTIWKDKDTIFFNCGQIIENTDADSFEYLGDGLARDKNNNYSLNTGSGVHVSPRKN